MDDNKPPEFFYRIFDASLPRLGAGDDRSTVQALDMLRSVKPGLTDKIRVLDLGCGNGAQTIQLAKHIDGTILALDNHQPFLDELQRRAEAKGVSEKIQLWLKDTSLHSLSFTWSNSNSAEPVFVNFSICRFMAI